MKRIEVIEPGGILHKGQRFEEGDIRSVEDEIADYFILHGWAKNSATGETGERKPGASDLVPDSVLQP